MTEKTILESIKQTPVIAAIKNDNGLLKCKKSKSTVAFILYGNINNISDIVTKAKNANKLAFVHIDLIEGLSSKEAAVDYIKQNTDAIGIISTKANLIKYAKSLGFITVQRFFILDSLAIENVLRNDKQSHADFIEILPGLMPKIIKKLSHKLKHPIIAGGLISDEDDVKTALNAGALGVSTTCEDMWFLQK